jgi:broad specificity phosphatase PhoE
VTVLLVRHARAGRRQAWDGDDRLRPLSPRGQQQAKVLAETLLDLVAKKRPVPVLSSPWLRCVATVAPLANAMGQDVTLEPALGEGSAAAALALVAGLAGSSAVLCTHGDVIEATLHWLKANGVDLGRRPTWPKASTWAIDSRNGRYYVARYLPPPA